MGKEGAKGTGGFTLVHLAWLADSSFDTPFDTLRTGTDRLWSSLGVGKGLLASALTPLPLWIPLSAQGGFCLRWNVSVKTSPPS